MSEPPAIPYGYNAERATFPVYEEDRHLVTFGPTRSGKGATVIVQTLLHATHSVVCIDPKGQNAAITARRRRALGQDVFVLNPFGLHTGAPWNLPKHRFNPLAHLSLGSENLVADVASLAESLILTEGKEPYFDNTARDLVKLFILQLVAEAAESGTPATLAAMRRYITMGEREFVPKLVEMAKSPHSFIAQAAPRFLREARDIQSAISSAITQTSFLDDPVLANPDTGTLTGNDFSMLQLKRKPTTVFLILPGRYMEAYARFFRLLITSAIDQLTAEPGGHPTLMLLDEFAILQNLGAVAKAFGFAAGFNLQCWAFLQDMPQLQAIYENKWESFIANAGLLQFFTPADLTTARYLKDRGGERTGESRSRSFSGFLRLPHGLSVNEVREPLLPIEETMSLPPTEQIVFIGGTHSPRRVGRQPYWKIESLRGFTDPDPYHL